MNDFMNHFSSSWCKSLDLHTKGSYSFHNPFNNWNKKRIDISRIPEISLEK